MQHLTSLLFFVVLCKSVGVFVPFFKYAFIKSTFGLKVFDLFNYIILTSCISLLMEESQSLGWAMGLG